MSEAIYSEINPRPQGFYGTLAAVGALAGIGLLAAWYMEDNGHYVMKNNVANSNYYFGRTDILRKLDLFVQDTQEASAQAEANLQEFLNKFGDRVRFEKHTQDSKLVKELGINSFPTFLVNNRNIFSER